MRKNGSSIVRMRKFKHRRQQRDRLGIFQASILKSCRAKRPRVVVLTGAGISAESGIDTFRASDGLWENHKIEDVATPEGYARNPELVQNFYNERRRDLQRPQIQPNAAHHALTRLEEHLKKRFTLITQNVDNLHERAGNENVIHMHGELLKVHCPHSGQVYEWTGDVAVNQPCSCCQPAYNLRPHIVWFHEMPLEIERIYQVLKNADYFIAIGTSGNVYPAAGFVQYAKEAGVYTIELNLEPSEVESLFDEKHYGKATEIVPNFIGMLLHDNNRECCTFQVCACNDDEVEVGG